MVALYLEMSDANFSEKEMLYAEAAKKHYGTYARAI